MLTLPVTWEWQSTANCHSQLNQVAAFSCSGYFQLRQLRPIIRSLTMEAVKTIAQAFISCCLDYCNSLLYSISDSLLQRLQSVQNAAARLLTGTRQCDDITPVLRQLHWLPVHRRIHFKIAGWVFRALTGSPAYLADDCRLISDLDRHRLRSSDIRTCVSPRTSTRFGDEISPPSDYWFLAWRYIIFFMYVCILSEIFL